MSLDITYEVEEIMGNVLDGIQHNAITGVGAKFSNAVNTVANSTGLTKLDILEAENKNLKELVFKIGICAVGPKIFDIIREEMPYINSPDEESLIRFALEYSNDSNIKNTCSKLLLDEK
jgi:hypothetical protein